ncbi:TonB-dependent receptor [Rhabdobacter roseus]|uniref:TonB-linked SusC/RagA family outer membrane protein n=1 Tax=Rhabdobacter roseus TaxID=1655419 RepID=A0A840TNU0_9BACT|nr:SusC/RagA family TonB-linked outer membrane protein [Rhabdobacter roseus]MBB5285956.1 TonB-linked SusC/RagA family outer membrane protein [Rhabdobacter roseus]
MTRYALLGGIIQCLFVGLLAASDLKAQEKSIEDIYLSANLRNMKLEDAFVKIVEKTDLNFQYDRKIVSNKKLSQDFTNESLGKVLRSISQETGLSFRRVNETIHVTENPTKRVSVTELVVPSNQLVPIQLASRNTASGMQAPFRSVAVSEMLTNARRLQAITITGRVTGSDSKEGMPGVSVVEKGTANGTTTNTDGNYSLNVTNASSVLVFSFIGYATQEVEVGNRQTVEVVLQSEDRALDEVVVVGYGTQKRANVTGAVATVTIDEKIASRSLANVSSGLAGLVPGMAVTQSTGMAGRNNASLMIRGLGTVNGAGPLIVVDGMPDVDINRINIHDIESVSVLKDATSASVYGSRAANGVILITTKSGKGQERASINYTGSYAVQVPTRAIDFMDDYPRALTLHQRAADVGTLRSNYLFRDGTIDQWMALGMVDPLRYPNTDWWDIIMRNGTMQNHNLSASGGNDKSNFFISIGLMDEKGLQINNDFKRYNARFNFDYKLNKNMNVGVRFQGNWSKFTYFLADGFTEDNNTAGYDMQYAIAGIVPYDPVSGYYGGTMAYNEDPQAYNPYTNYINNLSYQNRQEANANLFWDWSPIKGLTARIDYALNYDNQFRWNANMPNRAYNFQQGAFGARAYVTDNAGVGNFTNTGYKTMLNGRLTYNTSFGKNHTLSALAVYSEEYWYDRYQSSSRNDRLHPSLHEIDAALTDIQGTGGSSSAEGLRSYIGRLNYTAFDRYLLEVNFRADGSSKFLDGSRFGFFPSAALGWRFTEESFISAFTDRFLSSGKLRVSYGSLGNNAGVGRYEQQETLAASNYFLGNSIQKGFVNRKMVNRDLSWETTSVFNLGLDLGFLNNRLTAEIDFYDRLTTGMNRPSEMSIHLTGAYTAPRRNIGNLRNRGVELNLTWRDQIGQVAYGVNLNGSKNVTTLEKWNEFLGKGWVFLNMPYRYVYAWEDMGIAQTWEDVYNATPQGASPGDILRKDVNGDGRIDDNDKIAHSKFQRERPTTFLALNANASWRGFDIVVLVQGATGRKDFWLNNHNNVNFGTQRYASTWGHWENPWSWENRDGAWPRLGGSNNTTESTFWLDDLSYIRVKNVQLGYNVPKTVLRKIGLASVRIFGSSENIATLTKFRGLDPEKDGNRSNVYPINKSYSVGINIGI